MNPSNVLFKAKRFRVELASTRGADGTTNEREVVRHPGAVVILPMVDAEHVCLIKNFRLAVGRTLIELPAGTLEPGEDPEVTARRELAEETGYRAASWEHMHRFFVSPGILDERMDLYLATDLSPGTAAREKDEHIENLVVPWSEAVHMVLDGQIEDAKTMTGLLLMDRRRSAGS